jgi:hypothetical protein
MSIEEMRNLLRDFTKTVDTSVSALRYSAPSPTWKYEVTTYTRKRIRYWPSRGGRRWK